MRALRSPATWLVAALLLASGRTAEAQDRTGPVGGRVDAMTFLYVDDAGLTVATSALDVRQDAGPVTLRGGVLVDRLHQAPGSHHGGARAAATGVDVVSAASSSPGVDGDKTRVEGAFGAELPTSAGAFDVTTAARGRVSSEPGQLSGGGQVEAALSPNAGETRLRVRLGYGHDHAWHEADEAERDHVDALASISQIASARVELSGGVGVSRAWGTLSTPGQLAPYLWTFVPESVPRERLRVTAFARASAYLGAAIGLHSGIASYADDWGVEAISPDVRLARDFGDAVTMVVAYRLYWQTAASFHQVLYRAPSPYATGDTRLGAVVMHQPSLSLEWRVAGPRPLELELGYAPTFLEHASMNHALLGHVVSAGVSAPY